MKTMDKILEKLGEQKKAQEAEIVDIQDKIDIIKKYQNNHGILNSKQKKEILSLTCYGLSYCCGLEKNCIWRNSALKLLKISPKEYVRAKDICNDTLINKLLI